jgi:CheY-like chemotaxis protein
MPGGGQLRVTVANREVSPRFIGSFSEFPDARPGRYVLISVTDTGMGMPPEVRDRIFEPFFTTKETGTGLGLATSIGIIKSHGGFIDVSSEPGRGTRFDVYLPASEDVPEESDDLDTTTSLSGNGEMILVVDDEEAFRLVLRETLENCGFQVLVAEHGADGVAQYAQHADEIVAVITDIMMPVMDGYMLINAVRSMNPDARILAASGLKSKEEVDQTAGLKVDGFLTKPHNTEDLIATLGRVLAGVPAPL